MIVRFVGKIKVCMQSGKSKQTTPPKKMEETRVSPETIVAATAAKPAVAPRKRAVKTAAGDHAVAVSKSRTSATTKHRSAKPAMEATPAPRVMAAAAGANAGASVAEVSGHDAATSASVSTERIAELAYSYWLSRGCQGGNHQEDWFRAEQELVSRFK
jgi:hypothetical protein